MLKNDQIPLEDKESLHNRTYIGERLFKKLLAAERKRLQRRFGVKGEGLDRALGWSDINSGPRTEIGGLKISGDVILVIPASSQKALSEFSLRIVRREHKRAVSKIKTNAAGATFYYWLLPQKERPDRIGDIARDIVGDSDFPRESNQYEEIRSYLNAQGACADAIECLKDAWLEYLRQYPDRVQLSVWCSECGKRLDIEEAFLSWSPETLELWILDADCLGNYRQLEEVISCALSGMSYIDLEDWLETNEISQIYADETLKNLKLWGVMPVESKGIVYFVLSRDTGAIKIGFTAGPIEKRLSSLQTAHPHKLQLLASISGNKEYETELHERFSPFRLRGEWFQAHPELLDFIAVISKDSEE
jgi:uncharacterized protein YozE (UPF0346 family)